MKWLRKLFTRCKHEEDEGRLAEMGMTKIFFCKKCGKFLHSL